VRKNRQKKANHTVTCESNDDVIENGNKRTISNMAAKTQ
jgi:hypothetical protein